MSRIPLEHEPIEGKSSVIRYDRYASFIMRPEYRLTVKKLIKKVTHGLVLDVGTGSGRLAFELGMVKKTGFKIIGLDLSLDMLIEATGFQNNNYHSTYIDFIGATAANLPFADNTFDAVISYASLHHWQKPIEVFNEIWRVTKPGGFILIRDNRRMLDEPLYKAAIWIFTMFLPKAEKSRWPRSIMASFKLDEVREILDQTNMKHYMIKRDMGGFDLCIEAVKN